MAKFVPCIRNKRNDGLYPVYIRVFHNKGLQYINTGFLVSEKGIRNIFDEKGRKSIEIVDKRVLKNCFERIEIYTEKINRLNIMDLDCKTLIGILEEKQDDISFTDFTNKFIISMINEGRENPARNYKLSLSNLQKFLQKENITFNELTSKVIQEWLDSMSGSARKGSLYSSRVKAVFNAAIKKYNDYDLGIIRIKTNPFASVKIPKDKVPEKRSTSSYVLCRFFYSKSSFPKYDGLTRKEMAFHVSCLIFFLAGINAADLYDMKKDSLGKDWKLRYNRKKTRDKSSTGSYMEIFIPEIIRPIFDKLKGKKDSLFIFSERFADSTAFVKTVNMGIKSICNELGISENITTYTFRHSWATFAQNECGASTELVAFSLSHSSAHKVTEGYIRKDYTPVDRLNEDVINHVFIECFLLFVPFYSFVQNLEKK